MLYPAHIKCIMNKKGFLTAYFGDFRYLPALRYLLACRTRGPRGHRSMGPVAESLWRTSEPVVLQSPLTCSWDRANNLVFLARGLWEKSPVSQRVWEISRVLKNWFFNLCPAPRPTPMVDQLWGYGSGGNWAFKSQRENLSIWMEEPGKGVPCYEECGRSCRV